MTSNILCKYYMNGACAYGDQCRFSHNRQDESSQVCKFYLQGNCAYGDRCRYEHRKPSWSARGQPAPPSNYTAPSGVQKPPVGAPAASNGMASAGSANPNWDDYMTPDEMDEFEQWQEEQMMAAATGSKPSNDDEIGDIMDPADIPLCNEYAATGTCSAGEDCIYVHGDVCEHCQEHRLHPTSAAAAAAHTATCQQLAASIAKRRRDGEIECGICYEKVLSKPEMSQRRFGLLFCDHAFCLSCIRNWRSTAEVDTKTALRTCPICRTSTHFITPSTKWPDTPEAKAAIVDAYKAAMAQKDCVNFDFGDGTCPFGTSCFYRHAYKDGRLEEVHLRRAGTADGGVKVLGPVKLSSFLEASITAQRALARRPPQQQQQRHHHQQQQQQQQQDQELTQLQHQLQQQWLEQDG